MRPHSPVVSFPRAYTLFNRVLAVRDRLADLLRQPARRQPRLSASLGLEAMEERLVPTAGPLPDPVIFVGAGAGMSPVVKAYEADTGDLKFESTVFDPSFTGGVRVATGDFTDDGYPDLVAAAGPGGGPQIRILDGMTGEQISGPLGSFYAFDPSFRGGIEVAVADITGSGVPDLIVAAGAGGGPEIRVFSGETGQIISDFYAFNSNFRGGVTIAAADLEGIGRAQIAVGAGPGGGPVVKVYDPLTGQPISGPLGTFYAFDSSSRSGVNVGTDALAGDVNGDGRLDLAVGSGPGMAPEVKVFSGVDGSVVDDLTSFTSAATGGVMVGLAYVDGSPDADIVVGSGPGVTDEVQVYSGSTGLQLTAPLGDYLPFGTSTGGVYIAASNDPPYTPMVGGPIPSVGGSLVSSATVGTSVTYTVQVVGAYDWYTDLPVYPTGTVTITASNDSTGAGYTLGSGSLSATGIGAQTQMSVTSSILPVGTYTLTSAYPGDANFYSGSGTSSIEIVSPTSPPPPPPPPTSPPTTISGPLLQPMTDTSCTCAGPVQGTGMESAGGGPAVLTRPERSSGWGWLRSSSILNEFVLEVAGDTLR